jgi:hypothetical protein
MCQSARCGNEPQSSGGLKMRLGSFEEKPMGVPPITSSLRWAVPARAGVPLARNEVGLLANKD